LHKALRGRQEAKDQQEELLMHVRVAGLLCSTLDRQLATAARWQTEL
jgi:hypothetical protein